MSTTDVCTECEKAITPGTCTITCSKCSRSYHLGKCSGLKPASHRAMSEPQIKAWDCVACQTAETSTAAANDSVAERLKAHERQLTEILRKLDEVLTMKKTVDSIEKFAETLSNKYDEILATQKKHSDEIKNLKSSLTKIETQNHGKVLADLQLDIDDLEWRNRKMNLEFHNIPVTQNEKLLEKVNAMADILQTSKLIEQDIDAIHRLPSKPDKVPGIIVRFKNLATREAWFRNRGKLKEARDDRFILENLTKRSRALLSAAREWARTTGYLYAWHRDGKIRVRKSNGAAAITVRTVEDLHKIAT